MFRSAGLVLSLLVVCSLFAQPVTSMSTMCQAENVSIGFATDRRLIGCGAGFPDNLLWNLDRSDSLDGTLDQTVKRRLTGRGVLVYILDNGVLETHHEFQRATGDNIIAGIDISSTAGPECPVLAPCARSLFEWAIYGHGTAVASVVAGKQSGVAPDASIVAVRIESNNDFEWARALRAVIAHAYAPGTPSFRTAVVSMSASPGYGTSFLESAALMQRMVNGVDANGNADPNGRKFFFSVMAGNLGPINPITGFPGQCNQDHTPALFQPLLAAEVDGIIAVGGLKRDNTEWEGACRGGAVEVLAPAHEVLVASNSGTDRYRADPLIISGTSYSAPYVAGLAARMLEENPLLTPQQLEARMKSSPSRSGAYAVPVLIDEPVPVPPKRRPVRR
jgi:serine protease